jgi:hypothetical protein
MFNLNVKLIGCYELQIYCCLFILCISLFFTTGCDHSFEPLQKNDDLIFSMYGAVDVHGEFSIVRVMPVGERLFNVNPEFNYSKVFLIHNSTGERITYRDSLFKFGGDTFVWNFFSDVNLIANKSYRLVAENMEGRSSYANINLPSELPLPTIEEYNTGFETGIFNGVSNDPIVSVKTRYFVQPVNEFGCDPEMMIVISHLDQLTTRAGGQYRLAVNNRSEISRALGPAVQSFRINRREFLIVSSGEDWPDYSDLMDLESTLPETIDNVERGVGYVAGVAGRVIQITPPREPC